MRGAARQMTSSRVASFRRRNCPPPASGNMRFQPEVTSPAVGAEISTSGVGRGRPSLVDIRSILSLDDFEAFCVQASSGGSLYGMLRRQAQSAAAAGGGNSAVSPSKPTPGNRLMLRQRSKSLIQRSVALSEEKSIIKLLCDYTETTRAKHRLNHDNRRHSEAALSCGMAPEDMYGTRRKVSPLRQKQQFLTASQYLLPHKYGIGVPSSPCASAAATTASPGPTVGFRNVEPEALSGQPVPDHTSTSRLLPPSPELHRMSLVPPSGNCGVGGGSPSACGPSTLAARRSICRRRSFSLTRNGGLINDGDEMVVLPTSPTMVAAEVIDYDSHQQQQQQQQQQQLTSTALAAASSGSTLRVGCGEPFERRVSSLSVAAAPPAAPRSRTCSIMSPSAVRDAILTCQQLQGSAMLQPDDVIEAATIAAAATAKEVPVFRVLMLGGPGVGKTALTQQFVTSEYIAAQNTSFDDGLTIPIPVQLEGEESVIEFVDLPYNGDMNVWREHEADGYILVYSITDRRSYQKAVDLLYSMRNDVNITKPIILAANKSDLERSRVIGKQEGKTVAEMYTSKYIDVSAILNHHVDELLVGILKQLRLRLESPEAPPLQRSSSTRRSARKDSGVLPAGRRRTGFHSFRLSRKSRAGSAVGGNRSDGSPSGGGEGVVPRTASTSSVPSATAAASSSIIDMSCFKSASTLTRSRGSLLKRIVQRSMRRRHSRSCENLLRL